MEKRVSNYRSSRSRQISENAFRILANCWRVFRQPFALEPEKVKIITCIDPTQLATKQVIFWQNLHSPITYWQWRYFSWDIAWKLEIWLTHWILVRLDTHTPQTLYQPNQCYKGRIHGLLHEWRLFTLAMAMCKSRYIERKLERMLLCFNYWSI